MKIKENRQDDFSVSAVALNVNREIDSLDASKAIKK